MTIIRTVLGDIAASALGPTLTHEHVIAGWAGYEWDPDGPDRDAMIAAATAQLVELRETAGITAVLDCTTPDLGRDLRALAEISRRAGVHLVASTGLYRHTVAYPEYWRLADEDRLANWLRDDVELGTRSGGIRCGAVKVATVGVEPNELEAKLLRAAGRTAVATGCVVATHTEPDPWHVGNPGLAQVRALAAAGLDPSRVIVGHACNATKAADLVAVAETGASLGFDRAGASFFQPDDARADMFAALVEAGHADRLVLAHDHQAVWRTPLQGRRVTVGTYLHIDRVFLPMLRARGVAESALRRALVDNPARLLALRGAEAHTSSSSAQ